MRATRKHIKLFEEMDASDRAWLAREIGGERFPASQVSLLSVASLNDAQLWELEERITRRPLPLWEPGEDYGGLEE